MIDYTILIESLINGEWQTAVVLPFQKETRVDEADVIKLKEQVATLIVFGKTPARLRVAWEELSRGKIGGKHISNPREVFFFDDFTFDSARRFLITQLETALARVKAETP